MHTNFSLQRIKLLLLADKTELFRRFAFSILIFTVVCIFYLVYILNSQDVGQRAYALHKLGLCLYFLFFCTYVSQKMHQVNGQYLTLPASAVEKYTTLLIEGILVLVFFHLLFNTTFYLTSLLIPNSQPAKPDIAGEKLFAPILCFMASTFFLSNIVFRKYGNLIAGGCYAFLIFIPSTFIKTILRAIREPQGDIYMIEATPLYYTYNFLAQNYGIILYAATLVVLYISYLKLKEKQIR
ncbi:hypothetical protein NXY11_15705 [Parabacteroides faecis]|uniref:hypothetical protein n=1 Tax=Parabacteroides faecis TaxID=1217282 RepID=UPI002164885A|nr:hypothetical protein [Parabacteroides faecis]MCS2891745.1 hypothetical protein [Parabacteroides faecis]UVQ44641.1 hypothetical protein NXY11_15705 [Parabacteroides faecis]